MRPDAKQHQTHELFFFELVGSRFAAYLEHVEEVRSPDRASGSFVDVANAITGGRSVVTETTRFFVVRVDRIIKHSRYKRYVRRSAKFMAHDEENRCNIGDTVEIIESRPLSNRKRWAVRRVVRPAGGVASPVEGQGVPS